MQQKFDPKYHPQLIKWQTRSGLTVVEVCKELKISKKTLYRWRNKYPEVEKALRESRDFTDSLVEDSLLKRALGFKYIEQSVTKAGDLVEVNKVVIPDVGAIALWLKNRRRPRKGADPRLTWQDSYRVEFDGELNVRAITELSDSELLSIAARGRPRALTAPDGSAKTD